MTRTERLLNLVIALLSAQHPLPRATIQRSVAGYDPEASVAAFERMFERDKDELRAMGIPVSTVHDVNGEVQGYLIDEGEYAQSDIDLTVDELAVVTVAARVWDEAVLAPAAMTALRKIESLSGTSAGLGTPATFASITASDAALLPLLRAIHEKRVVRFSYRKPGEQNSHDRLVEPWSIQSTEGHWYLHAWDRERQAQRVFRLSRIESAVSITGQSCEHADRPRDLTTMVDPHDQMEAIVRIPDGSGVELTRLSGTERLAAGTWRITAPRKELLRVLRRADDRVEIESPVELAEELASGLDELAAMHS